MKFEKGTKVRITGTTAQLAEVNIREHEINRELTYTVERIFEPTAGSYVAELKESNYIFRLNLLTEVVEGEIEEYSARLLPDISENCPTEFAKTMKILEYLNEHIKFDQNRLKTLIENLSTMLKDHSYEVDLMDQKVFVVEASRIRYCISLIEDV